MAGVTIYVINYNKCVIRIAVPPLNAFLQMPTSTLAVNPPDGRRFSTL